MAEPAARLYLVTPVLDDASFAPRLAEACAAGDVAAVLLRLAAADERGLDQPGEGAGARRAGAWRGR